jgi:hypothetical protein
VDFCGHLWSFVDFCGLLWTFVDFCGLLWTFVDFCGLPKPFQTFLNWCQSNGASNSLLKESNFEIVCSVKTAEC